MLYVNLLHGAVSFGVFIRDKAFVFFAQYPKFVYNTAHLVFQPEILTLLLVFRGRKRVTVMPLKHSGPSVA